MTNKSDIELYLEACEAILRWADEKDRGFDTEFVESVVSQLEAGHDPSERQMNAIDNIIDKFHIEV